MMENFSFKWNGFQSNISKSFGVLRNKDYLHDVTLVGDDCEPVLAHKLVLSTCSEYFKNIFKMNKNEIYRHPFICLSGVTFEELNKVLDYIYFGEVQVYQGDIHNFLEIAQRLKIDGLQAIEDAIKDTNVSIEPQETKLEDPVTKNDSEAKLEVPVFANIEDIKSINKKIDKYMESDDEGNYKCNLCGKTAHQKWTIRLHIETHISGLKFPCNVCDKTYSTRNSLLGHKTKYHKRRHYINESQTQDHSWIL